MEMKSRQNFNNSYRLLTGVLLASVSGNMFAIGQQTAKPGDRPNILVVVCEDISPDLGCYGDRVAITPHLDAFSEQAVRHTDMYTSVGVSAPSRYTLITGRYASADGANYMRSNYFNKEFGVVPPAGVKCYTEFLRKAGYYCTNNAKTDYQFPAPLAAWDEQGAEAHWKHTPADRPFFSIFNLNITHESYIWKNTHDSLAVSPDSVLLPPYYPDTKTVRHDHAVLYSNIKKMDEQFRRLLDEVEKSERGRNTIVIFYSDNGGPLPRAKREIMDSGTHVPFMIRFPDGRAAGTVNKSLNMFVDIPATILSLAGVQPPAYMHGKAMYGKYRLPETRKYVFGATDRFDEQVEKRASIRSDRYLYIRNYMPRQSVYRPVAFRLAMPMMREMLTLHAAGGLDAVQNRWFTAPACEEELYDCTADPYQVNNLAADTRYSHLLKEMRTLFRREWIEPFNREWETCPEEFFVEKMWPGGLKPVCESPHIRVEDGKMYVENDLTLYSAVYQKGGKGKWQLYTVPVPVAKDEVVCVKLERIGYTASSKTLNEEKL